MTAEEQHEMIERAVQGGAFPDAEDWNMVDNDWKRNREGLRSLIRELLAQLASVVGPLEEPRLALAVLIEHHSRRAGWVTSTQREDPEGLSAAWRESWVEAVLLDEGLR